MSLLSRTRSLWRNVIRRDRVERDLDAELRAAQELLIEEKRLSGLSEEEARRTVAIQLGGLPQLQERVREVKSGATFHRFWRDLHHGARVLVRRPAFAIIAILSLAVAIGAVTATYSWVGHVLRWPPSGVTTPEQLVMVYLGGDRHDDEFGNILSIPHFRELEAGQTLFSGWAGSFPFYAALGADKTAVETSVAFVTGTYFSVLGVDMTAGKGIEPADDVPGGPHNAVISHRLWQHRFSGSTDTVGARINLNGKPFTVVGITGPEFEGPQYTPYGRPDVWVAVNAWVPLYSPARLAQRAGRVPQLHTVARLKPGVDIRTARAALAAAVPHLSYVPTDQQRIKVAHLLPIGSARIRPIYRRPIETLLQILFVVSILILTAACINVANFLISHGVTRRLEMGVRLALGATRRQLFQQLLTECLLLGAVSGVGGVGFALIFADILEQYPPNGGAMATFAFPATIDARALVFSAGVTLMATMVFGFVPALWLSLERPVAAVREAEWRWRGTGRRVSPRHALLGLQVALSIVITIVAALHMKSLANIHAVPFTFDPDAVLLARVNPLLLNPAQRQQFYRDLTDRLSRHTSVVSVGAAGNAPLALGGASVNAPGVNEPVSSDFASVGPGYFRTLKIPVIAGREFDASDEGRRVTILSATLAEQLWPSESPTTAVGKVVQFPNLPNADGDVMVVGIVDQPRCQDMLPAPHPCVYTRLSSDRAGAQMLHIRTRINPMAFAPVLQATISELASDVALDRMGTLESHIQTIRAGPRVAALMTIWLAGLTCVLTAIGCVALLWSLINEARRELAIRLALGSTNVRLIRLMMLRVLMPYGMGVVIGILAARTVAERISAQLYQTPADDSLSFLVPTAVLLLIGMAASYYPARLATRTNPSVLLRY
jgi:putative ABC transport system permease protein